MRTSKLGAAELSRNKHFVYCGAVKRDNSEQKFNEVEFALRMTRKSSKYY
jgi:hypothetical protein